MRNNRAFTILETVIVLAIMTMFFAISIPLFSKFTERTKLDTTARSIVSALRIARTYAITNNKLYYVFFDESTDPDSYYVIDGDTALPASAIDKVYKFPVGISFDSVGFGMGAGTVKRAVFKATGELGEGTGETAVVIEDKDGNQKTVYVEKTTGRARIGN